MALKDLQSSSLLEQLAELEHEQWVYWSKMLAREGILPKDRVKRWKETCWKPYNELTEEQKERDRKHAKKVLVIFLKWNWGRIHKLRGFCEFIEKYCHDYGGTVTCSKEYEEKKRELLKE